MLFSRPSFQKALLGICVTSSVSVFAASAFAGELTIATQYGNVQVNDDVKRVVALSEDALDSAIALDVIPLGAVATRGGDSVAEYIQQRAAGVNIVGTSRQSNLEAIASHRPELILASSSLPKAQYDILSKIAPTIVPVTPGMTADAWITIARTYAQALNKSAQMDDLLEALKERESALKTRVTAKIPATERSATLARWMPQGPIVMSSTIFATGILTATGFAVNDAGVIKAGRPHSSPLSLENLSKVDSDWLFLATLNTEGKDALEAAKSSPSFSRLNVVKQDHVFTVNGQLWTSASGPLAAHAILDDIEAIIDHQIQ
ncbi:iron-siderophore ABC transporter substrate-binding protein [Marinomonas sp. M1K-6]|uniref:Iron-siderophore ABC transporter substrate-binding protein n=1 Tax=Marinomonas profundi TaxID=2726122 RepID=A0A847QZB7_9GAMM|nr:iron-siderophore ABC transporter substrate-binding protein [Marinomonas profundi]NLQ18629.1 iron-siderophore ABC transporter substrate-binding protein [Marinomonas profundi]UDV02877.1 iron-siderophore ABC transporter substrate-binding protein [Marinomonas profundi]